jgi:neutral ceramidase
MKYIYPTVGDRFSSRHVGCRIVRWTELLLLIGFGVGHGWAAPLRAAVAKADITPPPGVQMWGFSNRTGPGTGTLDPLYARVLVLEASGKRLALVSVDLGRVFGPSSLDALRRATQKEVSFLVLAATHTHSAPAVLDQYPNGPPAWENTTLEKIANAVAEASKHLTDAQLGTGYGTASIGHNRLRANPDGTVTWFERNLTRMPTAPADATVSVLRVDGMDGQPIAILVNYACHPVVFGSDNLQYSADFPAVMTRTVEDAFTGKPLCFFLQGAPGDINPYHAVTPLEEDALGMRDWTGRTLGEEAVRIAKKIHTQADENPELQFAEDSVHVHQRWNPEKWREAMLAVFGSTGSSPFPMKPAEIALAVTTILINRKVAILTMPGEPFVEYQINWRQRCPVPDALFIGYANGYNGYFATIRGATLGGYGAANPATWVEVDAGERMVDVGVIRVNQMLGRLHELPEDFK